MTLRPIIFREAAAFVAKTHRHHSAPRGGKFCIGAENNGRLVGVVIAGRPIARRLDDGFTAEVTRLATDGTPNACSMLYGAAARTAKAMGYRRIITYTLESEPGTSLHAASWQRDGVARNKTWWTPSRPRTDRHPAERKIRWVRHLADPGVFG